jgi:hypothetical protein
LKYIYFLAPLSGGRAGAESRRRDANGRNLKLIFVKNRAKLARFCSKMTRKCAFFSCFSHFRRPRPLLQPLREAVSRRAPRRNIARPLHAPLR